MSRSIFIIALSCSLGLCRAQQTQTSYYANSSLTVLANPRKATYQKTVSFGNADEKTILVTHLKTGDTVSRESYKGNEPIGKWTVAVPVGKSIAIDYNFKLVYNSAVCKTDSSFIDFKKINTPTFSDNDSLAYVAPKLATGEKSISRFIERRIQYPRLALEGEISGTVLAQLLIDRSGNLESISIVKGINILLDKEAMRILRELRFSNGASFRGMQKKICALIPIRFLIGD